ncbi:hypothetical protein ACS0TY_028437 [Phlomoides rotata]
MGRPPKTPIMGRGVIALRLDGNHVLRRQQLRHRNIPCDIRHQWNHSRFHRCTREFNISRSFLQLFLRKFPHGDPELLKASVLGPLLERVPRGNSGGYRQAQITLVPRPQRQQLHRRCSSIDRKLSCNI